MRMASRIAPSAVMKANRYINFTVQQGHLLENVRYPAWTCREPIFSDSRDSLFNSRDPNRVPKTPLKNLLYSVIDRYDCS